MIPNLPDLETTPWARDNHTEARLAVITKMHNQKLAKMIKGLQRDYPQITFIDFDVNGIYEQYYDHPEKFGIKYVHTPCYKGSWLNANSINDKQRLQSFLAKSGLSVSDKQLSALMNNPQIAETLQVSMMAQGLNGETMNCYEYLFFDRVHPSHHGHYLMADFAIETLKKAGFVPNQ